MFDWLKKKAAPREKGPGGAVADLGALMEKYVGAIVDASLLPLPKPRLKEAIKHVYRVNPIPEARKYLPSAYMTLSNYQEGVGLKPLYPTAPSHPGGDISALELWLKWSEKVAKESNVLLAEWQAFERTVAR